MIISLIGPLAIHPYGLCIAAGVVTALVADKLPITPAVPKGLCMGQARCSGWA